MLADIGTLPHDIKEQVEEWVKKGGVLVRFAGPRLEKGGDDLLPVPLAPRRQHARRCAVLGDAAAARTLRRRQSVRRADTARRGAGQQAGAGRSGRARARRQGLGAPQGRHAAGHGRTARQRPGDLLPRHRQLGLVEPARCRACSWRCCGASPASAARAGLATRSPTTPRARPPTHRRPSTCWRPCRCSTASACSRARRRRRRPSPPPRSPTPSPAPSIRLATMARPGRPRALNLMTPKSLLKPLPAMPAGVERRVYEGDTAQPIKPQLLTLALALLFADILAVLLLQSGGLLFGRRAGRAGAAGLALLVAGGGAVMLSASPADAQTQTRPAAGGSGPEPRRRRPHHPGHRQGHLRLCALWRRRHRRGEPPGPRSASASS